MRLPDEIVAASEETGRRLRTHLGAGTPVTVAPNGIDLEAVRSVTAAAAPTTLVTVGRLLPHKRIDMLIEAIALLRGEGLDVTCRVIGDGPGGAALRRHATALGLGAAVEFRDDVSDQSELYALVKAARIFAFPSEREGFGIAALEGLACGLPVVTTSAPDNLAAALVRDSGRGVVCAPTPEAFASAVRGLLDAPSGEADADWLRRHDWEAVSDRVMERVLA
jgi:glycosyltransferase involved in cell wall biosynthesis